MKAKDRENKANKDRIRKFLEKNGISSDKIDVEAEYDSSISYDENLEAFCVKFHIDTSSLKEKVIESIVQQKKLNDDYVEKCIVEEDKRLDNMKDGCEVNLDEFFKIPVKMIKMIAQGFTHAVLFQGKGGLGKTYTILKTLKEEGMRLGDDFVVIKGYSTPLEFYKSLYEHSNKKVIVIDDIEGLFKNPVSKSILKAGLDNGTGVRIVTYSSRNMEVPTRFELKAGVIVCSNNFPTDIDFEAVKDRCYFYSFEFSHDEMLKIMSELIKKPYKDLTIEQRKSIYAWLRENIKPYHDNFSMRTLTKAYDSYVFDNENWTEVIVNTIKENRVKKVIFDLEKDNILLKDMYQKFREETGKSYRTFLRLRKMMGLKRYDKI